MNDIDKSRLGDVHKLGIFFLGVWLIENAYTLLKYLGFITW